MGIHSDSIYKDTQREVEAKKVDTEQVVGKDAEGNIFAKVEDTADGGKLTLYDETGTVRGEISIDDVESLVIDGQTKPQRFYVGGDEVMRIKSDETLMTKDLNMNDKSIKDPPNIVANDNMTANPEADTEDGYIKVNIGGTLYQIPIYAS